MKERRRERKSERKKNWNSFEIATLLSYFLMYIDTSLARSSVENYDGKMFIIIIESLSLSLSLSLPLTRSLHVKTLISSEKRSNNKNSRKKQRIRILFYKIIIHIFLSRSLCARCFHSTKRSFFYCSACSGFFPLSLALASLLPSLLSLQCAARCSVCILWWLSGY